MADNHMKKDIMLKKKNKNSTTTLLPPQLQSGAMSAEYERQRQDYCMYKRQPGQTKYTEVFIEQLAYNLLDWAKEMPLETAFKLSDYYQPLNLPRGEWYWLVSQNPLLRRCSDEARAIIGRRREWAAAKGEMKENTILLTLPLYDPEIKALMEWKAKLGAGDGQGNEKAYIIVKESLSGITKGEDVKEIEKKEKTDV